MTTKKSSPLLLALLAGAPLAAFAQSPAPSPEASAPAAASHAAAPGMPFSTEDREKLQAAHTKAMQDPAVQAALIKENVAADHLRAAMIAEDKSLGPILDKIPNPSAAASPGKHEVLSPEEREKVVSARDHLKDSPEGHAMKTAAMDFRSTVRSAMIAADPSVAPILDQIDAAAAAMHSGQGLGGQGTAAPKP